MTKAYLVSLLDYEEFQPLAVYINESDAQDRYNLEKEKIDSGRKRMKEHREKTGEYWLRDIPHYSSSIGPDITEVDFFE